MSGLLLSIIGGTFKDWVASRSKLAEKKAEIRAQAVANGIPGWSDEYLVVVWSYPAVGCFVPMLQDNVNAGMSNFMLLPEWYQMGFMSVTAAVFGLDKLIKIKQGHIDLGKLAFWK